MRSFTKASSDQPQRMLATAVGLAVASLAAPVMAEKQESLQLDSVTVQGERDSGYKSDFISSPKYTAPLLDTPQTITVVPQEVIEEQQALNLRQVLSNVSGITFTAGEGGGGSGDSINIRGFGANANMQIDGLRDSTQTHRTDTFNIEQVEVIKGPNSVFGGSGTTGGTINQVTKDPRSRDFSRLGASLGTDNYRRLTLDTNQTLAGVGEASAFRLNLMAHENDVPGRDQIERDRWGIAPSLALGLTEDTRLTLSYFHQTDDILPDYGVPARDGEKLAGVDREAYFGWKNLDKDEIETDAFTVKLEHVINDRLSLQNLTRYSQIDRDTVVSASHVNTTGVPAGNYRPAGPQGYGRDVNSQMLINQTNLRAEFEAFGFAHNLATGVELSREDYDRITYNHGLGTALYPADGYPLANPPGYWSGPIDETRTADTSTRLDNQAIYVFDTIALDSQWDLSLGLRYDWVDGEYSNLALTTGTVTKLETSDEMLSGRVGLVYKPAENGRIYVAYGTSFNPTAEFLATNALGINGGTAELEPEKNKTWELGTKWELLNRRLELDAAVFRVEKTNAREEVLDDVYALAGEQRVQGVELAVTGHVTEQWDVFANYTYLDSETIKSISNPEREGQALANTPPHSFNLWTSYQLPAGWSVGYGARYVSERNVASSGTAKLNAYWLHNAMIGYEVSRNFDLQLNLNNLFDEDYVERVRQTAGTATRSAAIEYGDGRSAILSANYSF